MKKFCFCLFLCTVFNAVLFCDETVADKKQDELTKLKDKLIEEGWTEEEIAIKLKERKGEGNSKENNSEEETARRNRREAREREKAQIATRKSEGDGSTQTPNAEKKPDSNKKIFTDEARKEYIKKQIEELKARLTNRGRSAEEIERIVPERMKNIEKDADNKAKWMNGNEESRKTLIEDIKKVMKENGRKDDEIENFIKNATKRWEN